MCFFEQRAYSLLCEHNIQKLPVDTIALARKLGYVVLSFSQAEEILISYNLLGHTKLYETFTVVIVDRAYIFYSDELTPSKRAQNIGHEIGHLQIDYPEITSSLPTLIGHNENEEEQEKKANLFERYLLAPLPALDQRDVISPGDIERLTGYDSRSAKEIYSGLMEYRQEQARIKQLQKIKKHFRRFTAAQWIRFHHHGLIISTLGFIIVILTVLLLLSVL